MIIFLILLGTPDNLLENFIVKNRNKLTIPKKESIEENTGDIYERVLLNCWSYEPFFRPNFSYLNEIFYNYFDMVEPNYDFLSEEKNNKRKTEDLFEGLVEANADDEINLGILLQAGNFSEIWTGNEDFYNNLT